MHEKDTDELFGELKIKSDVENFIVANQNEFKIPLHEYLNELLQKKNLTKKEVVKEISFDEKHCYHIFAGLKKTSRKKLLEIARAMNLNLSETQYLLRYGGYGILYPRDSYDAIIISAIEHNMTVAETNLLLEQLGELPLDS